MGLFFIGARWSEFDVPEGHGDATARMMREGAFAETPRWRTTAVAILALLVVQWPMWVEGRVGLPAGTSAARLDMPESLGAWRGEAAAPDAWRPFFPTASLRRARSYRGPQGAVTVHVAYFRGQTGDVKLVSSGNGWIDSVENHWNLLSQGRAKVDVAGRAVSWRTAKILAVEAGGRSDAVRPRLTAWQLYWIGGRLVHGDIEAKLVQAWLAVRGEPDDAAAVHLVSAQADDAAADRELATFVRENFDLIQASLMRARQSR
jgi:EpsI family protein